MLCSNMCCYVIFWHLVPIANDDGCFTQYCFQEVLLPSQFIQSPFTSTVYCGLLNELISAVLTTADYKHWIFLVLYGTV